MSQKDSIYGTGVANKSNRDDAEKILNKLAKINNPKTVEVTVDNIKKRVYLTL